MLSRKDQLKKDKEALWTKTIVTKNPVFTQQHIDEFYEMFNLYTDGRTKDADIKDIANTAKTLGLDSKYQIVYNALVDIANENELPMNFETFL